MKKKGAKTMEDNDGSQWLNEKHISEALDHKNLQVTTVKYLSDNKKRRYELVDESK